MGTEKWFNFYFHLLYWINDRTITLVTFVNDHHIVTKLFFLVVPYYYFIFWYCLLLLLFFYWVVGDWG